MTDGFTRIEHISWLVVGCCGLDAFLKSQKVKCNNERFDLG